jgi:hypothetical protein
MKPPPPPPPTTTKLASTTMTTTRTIYFVVLLWSLLFLSTFGLALTVPSHWRLNAQGQPRLCWVVETTLKGLTRIGLGSCPTVVEVSSVSNRAILQGKLSQLSLQVNHSLSKLIPVEEFLLQGSHLELGWTPLILTTLPWVLLLTRPPLFLLLSGWYLWSIVKKHRSASSNPPKTTEKSHLDYSLTWNNQNLSQSSLLKHAAQVLLRSLLSNSVLPMAAAAGDSIQNNNNNNPPQSTAGDLVVARPQPSSTNRLSTLLSATKFQLRGDPFFQSQGWLELPSQAILPNQQGTLDFVLRTKPLLDQLHGRIEFEAPQVQLDVRAVPLPFPKQILPETVWVPIGPGVAVETRSRIVTIDRLGISNAACRIDGRVTLGGRSDEEPNPRGNSRLVWKR